MKAVWIFAQPVKQRFLTRRIRRVTDRPAIGVIVFVPKRFRVKPGGQWCAVPGPMRRGTERELVFALGQKGLQSGCVGGESEFTVANGQRGKGIESRYLGVMPADERTAVNTAGQITERRQRGRREQQTCRTRRLEELSPVKTREVCITSPGSLSNFWYLHSDQNQHSSRNHSSDVSYQTPHNSPNCQHCPKSRYSAW